MTPLRAQLPEERIVHPTHFLKKELSTFNPKIIVIGFFTGGPHALQLVFGYIKGPLKCPILITQHMPPLFTQALAESLGSINGVDCSEAKDGGLLENRIYVAPGNYHMVLQNSGDQIRISLNQKPLINMVRPAVDPLFQSAAELFGASTLGIVLTGMGQDGKDGCISIKKNRGGVIIQEKDSCVVYGMPGPFMSPGPLIMRETLMILEEGSQEWQ